MGEVTDTSYLIDAGFGHVKSESLYAAVECGVFNALGAKGPMTSASLATEIAISTTHVDKLLNFLTLYGLLDKKIVKGQETFSNTALSNRYLYEGNTDPDAVYIGDWVKLVKAARGPVGYLVEAVRNGGDTSFKSHDMFEKGSVGEYKAAALLTKSFDLSKYKTYIDIGGNLGEFPRQMTAVYPNMKVMAFDKPEVCEAASKNPANKTIEYISGDFTTDSIPTCDLYSINHKWRNWDDVTAKKILNNVVKSMKSGSGLFILDSIYDPNLCGPGKYNRTRLGRVSIRGKFRRTWDEFTKLLSSAGLEVVSKAKSENFGLYDAIYAIRR